MAGYLITTSFFSSPLSFSSDTYSLFSDYKNFLLLLFLFGFISLLLLFLLFG